MKRFALIMFLVMAFSVSASAEGMIFGAKGGLNLAKVYGDDVDESDFLYGGIGGAFFCYMVNDMFAVQPELLFAMKGGDQVTSGDETGKTKLNYIEIPVLLRLHIPTEGSLTPAVFAGPSIGFLMSAKFEDEDIKDDLKSTDFGLVVGAGLDHMLGENGGFITFDVRYSMGLSTVVDIEGVDEQPDVKNMGLAFMVGYGKSF